VSAAATADTPTAATGAPPSTDPQAAPAATDPPAPAATAATASDSHVRPPPTHITIHNNTGRDLYGFSLQSTDQVMLHGGEPARIHPEDFHDGGLTLRNGESFTFLNQASWEQSKATGRWVGSWQCKLVIHFNDHAQTIAQHNQGDVDCWHAEVAACQDVDVTFTANDAHRAKCPL
jgi:hypothetical protein